MWPALSGLFYFVWHVCAFNCSCRMHCWRHVSTLTSLMSSKWVALVIWHAVLSFFYLATVCCWHLLPSWSNINVFSVSRLAQKEIGNFSARAELCNSKFCLMVFCIWFYEIKCKIECWHLLCQLARFMQFYPWYCGSCISWGLFYSKFDILEQFVTGTPAVNLVNLPLAWPAFIDSGIFSSVSGETGNPEIAYLYFITVW